MKNLYFTLLFSHIVLFSYAQTPSLDWVNSYGSTQVDAGSAVVLDASGNLYNLGTFRGTVDFDSSANIINLTSNGSSDIYLQKLNSDGSLIWAKSIGGVGLDYGRQIKLDDSGNIYVIGTFQSTVDFDPSSGTYNLSAMSSNENFILKLDSNGSFIWAVSFGRIGYAVSRDLMVDSAGDVYLTGSFQGTVDFDPSGSTFNLTATNPNEDVFIQKLNTNGIFEWAISFGGNDYDASYSIDSDSQNNIYVTGSYRDTTDFDPSSNEFILTPIGGIDDIYLLKLDSNSNFIWVKSFGNSSFDFGLSLTIDSSDSIYLASIFEDTVDFDPSATVFELTATGYGDIAIQKLDSDGNFIWAKSYGPISPLVSSIWVNSIAIDLNNDLYLTGYFKNTINFSTSGPSVEITSNGMRDGFVQKLDSDGDFSWATSIGGVADDDCLSIIPDNSGNVYITGNYQDVVDFDPSSNTYNLTSSGGSIDAFIQKLNSNPLSIDESTKLSNDIVIYPNPTMDIINFNSSKPIKSVIVSDISGRRVLTHNGNEIKFLNVETLKPGVYLFHVILENFSSTRKIIKY